MTFDDSKPVPANGVDTGIHLGQRAGKCRAQARLAAVAALSGTRVVLHSKSPEDAARMLRYVADAIEEVLDV